MRLLRSDLPLAGDVSGRFLPWIIGCMAYLAALALAATMAADRLAQRWHNELSGTFSIQIPPGSPAVGTDHEDPVSGILDQLMNSAGVASARVVDDAEKAKLLEPWLGADGLPPDVRLPDLIVVQLAPGASLSADLRGRIAALAPAATIEDHARWQGDMLAFSRSVKLLAGIIIGLIMAAAVTTVIFVTSTGLAIHRRVIEIVHLVGARDSYIAKQFLMHALRLGLLGGIGGVVLAGLTLMGLDRVLAQAAQTALLPSLSLDAGQWLALAVVPLAVSAAAMVTAHLTVLYALARGP